MRYSVLKINVFEQAIFNYVDITTCAFQFELRNSTSLTNKTEIIFFPDKKIKKVFLHEEMKSIVALDCLENKNHNIIVQRFVKDFCLHKTNIVVYCIDGLYKKIHAKMVKPEDIPNQSNTTRSFFIVCVNKLLSNEEQQVLVNSFNDALYVMRKQHSSLIFPYFLGLGRKRIPFDVAFTLLANLINELNIGKVQIEKSK